jgi:hypothetical protein
VVEKGSQFRALPKQAYDGIEHIGFVALFSCVSSLLGLPLPLGAAIMMLEYVPVFGYLELRDVRRCMASSQPGESTGPMVSWCSRMLEQYADMGGDPGLHGTRLLQYYTSGVIQAVQCLAPSWLLPALDAAGLPTAALMHPRFLARVSLLAFTAFFMTMMSQLLWNGRLVLERVSARNAGGSNFTPVHKSESQEGVSLPGTVPSLANAGAAVQVLPSADVATSKSAMSASNLHQKLSGWTEKQAVLSTLFRPLQISDWLVEAEASFMGTALSLGIAPALVPLACMPVVAYTYIRWVVLVQGMIPEVVEGGGGGQVTCFRISPFRMKLPEDTTKGFLLLHVERNMHNHAKDAIAAVFAYTYIW